MLTERHLTIFGIFFKSVFCWVQSNFQILRSVKCFVCKRQVLLLILSNTKFNSIFGTTFFLTFHITNSVFTVLLHRMMYYSALRTAFFSVYLEWMDNFDSSPVNFGTDCGNIGHWPMDFRLNSCWPPNAIDLHGKMIEKIQQQKWKYICIFTFRDTRLLPLTMILFWFVYLRSENVGLLAKY